MNIAQAPAQYDKTDQDQMRGQLKAADAKNIKLGQVLDEILVRDTATGTIRTVVITSGAWVIT